MVSIEWDEWKNSENRAKHGISFEEAQKLFTSGQDYLELYDEEHSIYEDRFIAIGFIPRGLSVVVMTEIDDDVLRIISARWATKREQRLYNEHMEHRHD